MLTPRSVYRRFETDGVPSSGLHDPNKDEIIQLLELIQSSGGQSVVKNTLAQLNATTPPAETYGGIVLSGAGAGYYSRAGAAWVFGRSFPDTFAKVLLAGSGAAQAGAVSTGVNPSSVEVFFAKVATPNTGPLTLSISGGTARTVVNLAGNPLAPGEWTGMVLFYLNDANQYQLLLDAGAAASAAASASAARQALEDALAMIVPDNGVTTAKLAGEAVTEPKLATPLGIILPKAVTTRAALKDLSTNRNQAALLTEAGREGYFALKAGNYAAAVAADTGEGMFVKANDSAATAKVWARVDTTMLHPLMFGAEGQADCTQAFLDCLAAADYLKKPMHILERALSYPIQGSTNFAAPGRTILGVGHPIIESITVGTVEAPAPIIKFDVGGATGANQSGLTLKSLILKGNATTINGLYMRGQVHADIEDIEVRNVRNAISPGVTPYSAAFNIIFGVAGVYKDLQYRPDTFGQTYKADRGIWLNQSSSGYYTADCTFQNVRMEGGIDVGISVANAAGNLFIGGTSEGCGVGVDIEDSINNQRNVFTNLWCEANTYADTVVRGFLNKFENCNFVSNGTLGTVEVTNGQASRFRDCFIRHANLQSPSKQTLFNGCAFSDNPALGLTGTGTRRVSGCVKVNTSYAITSVMPDE